MRGLRRANSAAATGRSAVGWRWAGWRWRVRQAVVAVGWIGTIVLLSYADRRGWLLAHRSESETYDALEATVVRVIDGDTIEIDYPDDRHHQATTHVRVWGIDCPETAKVDFATGRRKEAEPWADEAMRFARDLVEGQRVTLRLEPQRTRDHFGRVLAHVTLADGANLAEELLIAGLARADERWWHSMIERYLQAEGSGRLRKAGLWSEAGG